MTEMLHINNRVIVKVITHRYDCRWLGKWISGWSYEWVIELCGEIVEGDEKTGDCGGRERDWIGLKSEILSLNIWPLKLIIKFHQRYLVDLLAMTFFKSSTFDCFAASDLLCNSRRAEEILRLHQISSSPLHSSYDNNAIILSRVWSVTIDGFWIDDRDYWTLWHSTWLRFTIHYYAHTLVSTDTFSLAVAR
jgi:hypothetical protein